MTWIINEQSVVPQAIADTDTVQNVPLGTIVKAKDSTNGEGEFIYLEGVASTVAGSVVTYDDSFQTALASIAVNTPRPLAIAMSANVAGQYGWYQIGGLATAAKAASVSFAKAAAFGATSGLAVAAASGIVVNGALVAAVASAKSGVTSVKVMVDRPHAAA